MVRETKKKIYTILNINDKNKLKLEPNFYYSLWFN